MNHSRKVEIAEVVKYFLFLEAQRKKYIDKKDKIYGWLQLSNDLIIQKAKEFAKCRDDENPTLVWTVGTEKNNHYKKIAQWVLKNINLRNIYSCGINSKVNNDLNGVNGNIFEFTIKHSHKYQEFNSVSPICKKFEKLIVIEHTKKKKQGNLEIIDGVHRVVSMIKSKNKEIEAYVGVLKKT